MLATGPFMQRAAAYAIDYLVIALYAVLLAAVTLALGFGGDFSKSAGYALALATLTGPVVLVFTGLETLLGATPGKAVTSLTVQRANGGQPGFGRALVRNLIKFAPWEIAHAGIWLTPGQPFVNPPGLASLILMNAALGLVAFQALLIWLFRAGLHDWPSGLRVVARNQFRAAGQA